MEAYNEKVRHGEWNFDLGRAAYSFLATCRRIEAQLASLFGQQRAFTTSNVSWPYLAPSIYIFGLL